MFDFDIPLLICVWITITTYLDCSHVSIELQCIHTYMSLLSFLVWRTRVGIRTGQRWIATQLSHPPRLFTKIWQIYENLAFGQVLAICYLSLRWKKNQPAPYMSKETYKADL